MDALAAEGVNATNLQPLDQLQGHDHLLARLEARFSVECEEGYIPMYNTSVSEVIVIQCARCTAAQRSVVSGQREVGAWRLLDNDNATMNVA